MSTSSDKKITNDATASFAGSLYQIVVALEKAFELNTGQKIWIEKFGDVTVSTGEQIEVKHYHAPLTAAHENLWKTIRNWMQSSFDSDKYTSLTLWTTQAISVESDLIKWNQLNSAERRQILVDVHHRLDNSPKKKIEQDQAPKAAALRAWVLAADQHSALSTVLGKMRIAHGSLKTDALRERIFGIYGKIILKNKKDNYLDDLMGYLISPMHLSHGWEITYEGFAEHLTVVSARYSRETRKFPAKLLKAGVAGYEGYEGSRFVRKIEEIAYGEVVPDAIRHYLVASRTILEEFRNYSIDPDSIEVYRQNHISAYSTKYRVARRNCGANKFGASQDFYDQIIGEPPQAFCAFDTTPIEFRNGLIHMIADEDEEKLKWRLW